MEMRIGLRRNLQACLMGVTNGKRRIFCGCVEVQER